MIDREAGGIITTDRYGAYNRLTARRRQVCRAHLARERLTALMKSVRRKVKRLLQVRRSVRAEEDRAHLRECPQGGAMLVDVPAGRRGGADEQRGGARFAAGGAVAAQLFRDAERER
jgi:hypothetical protein